MNTLKPRTLAPGEKLRAARGPLAPNVRAEDIAAPTFEVTFRVGSHRDLAKSLARLVNDPTAGFARNGARSRGSL